MLPVFYKKNEYIDVDDVLKIRRSFMKRRLVMKLLIFWAVSLLPLLHAAKLQFDEHKLPLVYHPNYNIGFFGIEKLHPFDTKKYGKVYEHLLALGFDPNMFYTPEKVSDETLLQIHTQEYLDSLKRSYTIARIAEVPVCCIPNFLLQWCLLDPMRYATQGTIEAVNLALRYGWAINLGGGYHHAKSKSGSGFCYFADISLAMLNILKQYPDYKILYVDLDAHQGNGVEAIKGEMGWEKVYIFDVYRSRIFPHDVEAMEYIDFNYPIYNYVEDEDYLNILRTHLLQAIDKVQPNLIIYNAGTDIFELDRLGYMNVSKEGIIKRDELVFRQAQARNIPIAMVFAGGYTLASAGIIGESIENLFRNVLNVL